MNVPEESATAIVILTVFIGIVFSFLICLTKGCLSERQQTGAWAALALLFFSLCSVLVRTNQPSAISAGHLPDPVHATASATGAYQIER